MAARCYDKKRRVWMVQNFDGTGWQPESGYIPKRAGKIRTPRTQKRAPAQKRAADFAGDLARRLAIIRKMRDEEEQKDFVETLQLRERFLTMQYFGKV